LNLGFGTLFLYDEFNPFDSGTNLLDDTDLAVLNSLTNLQILSIGGLENVTSIDFLNYLPNLTQLWMGHNPITDWTPLDSVKASLNVFFEINCGLGQNRVGYLLANNDIKQLFVAKISIVDRL
jgi:hypothetical protein